MYSCNNNRISINPMHLTRQEITIKYIIITCVYLNVVIHDKLHLLYDWTWVRWLNRDYCCYYDIMYLLYILYYIAIFIALTLYATFTKTDFTTKGGIITIIATTLMVLTLISIFTYSSILNNMLCGLGVILFGVFIVFDTQKIVGGKMYSLKLDDYIQGALILYIDIIQMFIYILRLLSNRRWDQKKKIQQLNENYINNNDFVLNLIHLFIIIILL